MDTGDLKTVPEKLREHFAEKGLRVAFRVRNNKVDYSIMNRPEPTLTGISDEALATAIVDAVQRLPMKRSKKPKRVKQARDDGKDVVYKEAIVIDWTGGFIRSSVASDLALNVMSIVVQNLMGAAMRSKAAEGGLN